MQEEISFGVWLRKQRRVLDLSRRAFADQVGCAEVTLRRMEAGTLKPSKELAQILLEKFGIPETEKPQWISFARGLSGFPLISSASSNKLLTNLPASLTTFIGREKEQSDVIRLITKHRLVTLTGPGGVGKTRLAIKIGEQVLGNYADGVWFVEFAPILDLLLVPRVTAIVIGLHDEPQRPVIDMLSDYLREKKMLIILDNCEHLLDACAELADTLLKRCPGLKILVTSREALGMLGEAVYSVPSLELPEMQQLLEKFRDCESVHLFDERAQLARMDFSLTIENVPWVAKICSQLDGIPLAIELAAARVNMFSIEQIAGWLQESFDLLTTGNRTALPRHRTLQAAIDWSYDLLSLAEQTLFQRLSIFVNGWTLEAAESICSDANIKSEAILDLLTQLTNKSLVIVEEGQVGTRYRMLETIRQYADEKLVKSGERDELRSRHLAYFLRLVETAEPHLMRSEQLEWLPVLDADYENLRLAFEWALNKEATESALKLCIALGWYWKIRARWLEGVNYIKRALAKSSQTQSMNEKVARARALAVQASLEWQLGNYRQILSPAQESLTLASEVSDRKDIAIARFYVGLALARRGENYDQALSLLEQSFTELQALKAEFWQARFDPYFSELLAAQAKRKLHDRFVRSLELARKVGERVVLADVLSHYASWLFTRNLLDEAKERAEEAERLIKQLGFHTLGGERSFVVAAIAWLEGDTPKARSIYMKIQERFSLLGDKLYPSIAISQLGLLAMEEGDLLQAQTYLEQGLLLSREMGSKIYSAIRLIQLSHLFYLQGNLEAFRQNAREGLSLRSYFLEAHKVLILETILGSLYVEKPESSARILGIIDDSEQESDLIQEPITRLYSGRAEAHAREVLGDAAFEAAFADGQKMSVDEGLGLALRTVDEM